MPAAGGTPPAALEADILFPMPSPRRASSGSSHGAAERDRRRRPRGRDLQPRQGALSRGRLHQARPRALLPRRRRRRAARRRRPAQRAGPLSQRHRRRVLLSRSARRPRDRPGSRWCRCAFPSGRSAEEVVPRDAAALAVDGQPRVPRAAPASGARRGSRSSRRAAGGSRSGAGRRVGPGARGGAGGARRRSRISGSTGWPKTSGSRGHARHRADRAALELRPGAARGAGAGARGRAARAALATSKWWKEERHGVFVDYNQNAKDRTVAVGLLGAADARRAGLGAARAGTRWTSCDPGDFTLATMPARFAERRRPARGHRRHAGLARAAAGAVGAARARGPGRRALAAALPEAAGRAAAGAALEARARRSIR